MMKFSKSRIQASTEIFNLINKISNKKKKNIFRGYYQKRILTSKDITTIRNGNSCSDGVLAGSILNGPKGLRARANEKLTAKDIYYTHSIPPLEFRGEICFTAGYINSMKVDCLDILSLIFELAFIETIETDSALEKLVFISSKYGASNYLCFKLAYLKSSRDLTPTHLNLISQIENNIEHTKAVGLQSSALENVGNKISIFSVASRRIASESGRLKEKNFRSSIPLNNLIPTPICLEDISGYLLRATESCLIDTLYSLIVLINLKEHFADAYTQICKVVDEDILKSITTEINQAKYLSASCIITSFYALQNNNSENSLNIYRASSAFLERHFYANFRHKLDKVIGARLIRDVIQNLVPKPIDDLGEKSELTELDRNHPQNTLDDSNFLDTFYRTYKFLKYISDKTNILFLSIDEIEFIFDNTMGLENLMSEDEIRSFYLTAPLGAKNLVAVLALALYRKKSVNPDVDFDFRTDFISHVIQNHNSSILKFIDSLTSKSPSVANYIVGSLDEVTLEKMYALITNATQALEIRRDILRAIGTKLNRIEFFIEADSIVTRFKVAKLQQYFDSSRMYVDSVAMKKWLDVNPSIYIEQYRNLYPKLATQIGAAVSGDEAKPIVVLLQNTDQSLIEQIIKEAFEEFCLNNEFGIQSYLGRRIRHNTLDGVMNETVDAVFKKDIYRALLANPSFRKSVNTWNISYKFMIEKLKKEQLQFKSNASLFNATVDLEDPITNENIWQLTRTLRTAGGAELLNDLVITTCWKQIAPQLENASRFIKTELLNEAQEAINYHFSKHNGQIEKNLRIDLSEAISTVFRKVASWFQVPQTGFVSASVRELCQIIIMDMGRPENQLEWDGAGIDRKYTGISVHRIYDCIAVLLQNAFKHGETHQIIKVQMESSKIKDSLLEDIKINVISNASEATYHSCKKRIREAIESKESGADMVTEGYSGIKKLKFITKLNEGHHTIKYSTDDANRLMTIGFKLRAEISN